MNENDQFNLNITRRLLDPDFRDQGLAELTPGRESPHQAFTFAEEVTRGNFIADKLTAARTAGETSSDLSIQMVIERTLNHLEAREKLPEDPLGETQTDMSRAIYGPHPYSESYIADKTIEPPTTMHTQTQNQAAEEQTRRSREIAEQNQIDLSQASVSPGLRENQTTDESARQPANELEPAPAPEAGQQPDKAATGQEPELENQPVGSMDVNRANQSDIAMADAGSGGDGNDSSKPINLGRESFRDESSAVRDEYQGRQAVEQPATELEPAPVAGQQRDQAATELEPAPVVGQQQDQPSTELEPAPELSQHRDHPSTELEPAPEAGQHQNQPSTELEPAPEAAQQQDQPATDLEPAPEVGQQQNQPVPDQTQDHQR